MAKQELAIKIKAKKGKHEESEKAVVDPAGMVQIKQLGRSVRLAVVARYFRMLETKRKGLVAMQDTLKESLRDVGVKAMNEHGGYVASAVIGCVKVNRSNRFKAIEVDRGGLIDAVGGVEYCTMFQEKASIVFPNIPQMRRHVELCEAAGVPVDDLECQEEIVPKSTVLQRLAEVEEHMEAEKVATVRRCLADQAAAVGLVK